MWELIWLDGGILPLGQAGIPLTAAGALYGSGAFTTLPFVGGRGFQWARHLARLTAGLEALGIVPAGGLGNLESGLKELAAANRTDCGLARIALVEGQGDLWKSEGPAPRLHCLMFMKPLPAPRVPARLGVSNWPVFSLSRLRGHKLVNYAEPWHALAEAQRHGDHEAVRLDERGRISGGCRSALLWRAGGELWHPSPECGGVRSTTLAWAVETLAHEGRAVGAAEAAVSDLQRADEILLLSAGVGVRSVCEFQARQLPADTGELAEYLALRYKQALESLAAHG